MTKLIALVVEDDPTFALPAWNKTIPLLERKGLLVTHVAVVPSRVDRYQGLHRSLWYLNAFGLANAVRFGAFALLEQRRRANEPRTWDEMAHTHALVVERFEDPNGMDLQTFLRSSQCDVLHVLAPVNLGSETLGIPRAGVIAQHASMLPSCRGMFPYFWARMNGEPLGQSLLQVTGSQPATAGPLLAQQEASLRLSRSMLAFQVWAARQYPQMALDATLRLLARRTIPARTSVEASYCGLPTRGDRLEFEKRGGRLSCWRDLRLTLAARSKPAELATTADEGQAQVAVTAFQFPSVMPLKIKSGPGLAKVIPMRRRGPVHEV
jgi:hypothetical protein